MHTLHSARNACDDLYMNKTTNEIAAKISAHTYTHAAWMKSWEDVALKIMAANMGRGQAGKASPVAAKALARIEANFLTK